MIDTGLLLRALVTYLFSAFLVWAGARRTSFALGGRNDRLDYGTLDLVLGGTDLGESDAMQRGVWIVFGPICVAWGLGLAGLMTYLLLFSGA
ncbi:hypothetical protein [Haloarchaeobius baliensis]|uniref:hypothetical protein n=1 Tax=Haloarchaeobius baliensis TaxID=1670458 RepID=UPI003F880F13